MVDIVDRSERLGSLFVSITGRSTIIERQQDDPSPHFGDYGEEDSIASYLGVMTREDGLQDVIQDPE